MRSLPSLLCATSLLVLAGCATGPGADSRAWDAAAAAGAGGAFGDPGREASTEAGDAGLGPAASADAGIDAGSAPARTEASFGDTVAGDACFNFADDDMNGVADCADPTCASPTVNIACCVASTARDCCVAPATDTVQPRGLCASAGTQCLEVDRTELLPTLGDVYPAALLPGTCSVTPGLGFAPIGTDTSHGYLPLPDTYDPAAAYITITGRIGVADVMDPRVAAAGFGLFAPQGLGAIARPLVGIAASATSDDLRVIVGDRVVATADLSTETCGRSWDYQIRLTPMGGFEVYGRAPGADPADTSWGERIAGGSYDVVREARVAMFGQQPNPMSGGPTAWVSDLTVGQSGCDLLAPARRRDAIVPAGTTHDVTGISVFPRDASITTAYEALVTSGDQVYWMSARTVDGVLVSGAGSGDPFAFNIQPASWTGYARFQDIEVLLDGGTHHVFVAAAPAGDPSFRILHAEYVPAAGPGPGVLSAVTNLLSADEFDDTMAGLDAVSVDGVTALRRTGGVGIILAVRVRYADGTTAIRIAPETVLDTAAGFESASPPVVGRGADGTTTDGLVAASQTREPTAFDRDEVADPQLVEEGGVVRVLYAGRRGTRWSLGMIVASPDFTHFAPADRAPFLGPSGSGFDALGVTEPFLVRREGFDRLYYAGSDGARRSIGLATQPVVGSP